MTVKAARFAGVKMDVYVGLPAVTWHEMVSNPDEEVEGSTQEKEGSEVRDA